MVEVKFERLYVETIDEISKIFNIKKSNELFNFEKENNLLVII